MEVATGTHLINPSLSVRMRIHLPILLFLMVLCLPIGVERAAVIEVFFIHGCHDYEEFENALRYHVLPALAEL